MYLSDKEKIFIFKFENKVMSGKVDQTHMQELVPKSIYLFEIEAIYLEDIVLDLRDRIVSELTKIEERGLKLSSDFISEIEGKMDFQVRKVVDEKGQLKWTWKEVNDFDRLEKFSDDEVFEDEVVFKLLKPNGKQEELLDMKSQNQLDGYNCYTIYKHTDNSYEWRLCKVVGKEMRPEFKAQHGLDYFVKSDNDDKNVDSLKKAKKDEFGSFYKISVDESDKYFYFLEFEHLKTYGKEMWCKRKREDIIFSSGYSRDAQNFESSCFKFIQQSYQ